MPEKKYIDINVKLYDILQNHFTCNYNNDLVLYAQSNKYPDVLGKYDKKLFRKRIVATIFYLLFSIPSVLSFLINFILVVWGII